MNNNDYLKKCDKQYQITHNNINCFQIKQKVFLKSNPEVCLTIEEILKKEILCSWYNNDNIKCYKSFLPQQLLQYKWAGLLIFKDKYLICLN